METHTPTPWKFVPWHIEEDCSAVRAPDGHLICSTASDANAAFIVRAVNQHADLLRAAILGLEAIDTVMPSHEGQHEHCQLLTAFQALERVIAIAEGRDPAHGHDPVESPCV